MKKSKKILLSTIGVLSIVTVATTTAVLTSCSINSSNNVNSDQPLDYSGINNELVSKPENNIDSNTTVSQIIDDGVSSFESDYGINSQKEFMKCSQYDFEIDRQNKTLVISRYKGNSNDVIVPSNVVFSQEPKNTYTIVGIGQSAFSANKNIRTIKLPNTITFIGMKRLIVVIH